MELTEKRYHNLSDFSRTCVYCNRPVYKDDYNNKNYVMVAKNHRFILSHKNCFLKYLKFCKESKRGDNNGKSQIILEDTTKEISTAIYTTLNLIEKQFKELEQLKDIEQQICNEELFTKEYVNRLKK